MGQRQRNTARRHHIIPQLLLKRFAQDDRVWVLDRAENRLYRTNIINVACEVDYNAVETTGKFGQDCVEQEVFAEIEGIAEPIIQNMLNRRSPQFPQGRDWELMANFLALMYTRGPTLRKLIKRLHQFGSEVIVDHIYSDENTYKATFEEISKDTGIDVNMDYKEALRARQEMEIHVEIPTTHYVHETLLLGAFFVPVFADMTPNLEIVDVLCDSEYVISDRPIVPITKSLKTYDGWSWYKNPDADLFFPLSSRACLVLNYDALRKVTIVDTRRIALINHLMACNSQRVIISKKKDFVWRRENGTTSVSHEELLEFLEDIPCGPAETGLDKESLRKGILNKLKERPQSE